MPLFVYLVQSVKVPHDMIKTINTLIFKFLWHGKREKIKRSTLIGNKTEGGLDMLDTESFFRSLKIKWIKTLLNKEEANWKILPNYFLNIFGKDFLIFHMNLCHIKNIKNIENLFIPDFYKDLIENWLHSKKESIKSETFEQIRKQIIWGNQEIKFLNKCIIFKEWIKSGIIFVNDIIDENGNIAEQIIHEKLNNKCNWISELSSLKQAIPTKLKLILKSESSRNLR